MTPSVNMWYMDSDIHHLSLQNTVQCRAGLLMTFRGRSVGPIGEKDEVPPTLKKKVGLVFIFVAAASHD